MVNYGTSEYPTAGAALNQAFSSMGGAERLNLGANQFVSGGMQALHGAGIATVGTGNMAVGLPVATGEYLARKMMGGRRKSHRKGRKSHRKSHKKSHRKGRKTNRKNRKTNRRNRKTNRK